MKYCKYHDIVLCPTHEDQCLGDDCVLKPMIPSEQTHCSICCGMIKPKAFRERPDSQPA